ncbi:hypothetical protein EON83_23875 [bacterium]|nr:MAG: hypothetical protein EON83_23875 [bacterium]
MDELIRAYSVQLFVLMFRRSLFSRLVPLLVLGAVALTFTSLAWAQSVGRASGDFPNLRVNKSETPFGRLVADALLAKSGADCALINAGSLKSGTLSEGPIESTDLEALLSFSDDDVATLSLSGAQLKAALERAASVFPTGSPAFLQVAGIKARFDSNQAPGKRISSISVRGKQLDDGATYSVAMPSSLAEGAAGFFNIWNGAQKRSTGASLMQDLIAYIGSKGDVAPDMQARFDGA